MIIQYASDLHLEFVKNTLFLHRNPILPRGDILILAGDICYWDDESLQDGFWDYVSNHFKQVYYLPGNHEFYSGKDIKVLRKPVCEKIRNNVYIVSNVIITIQDTDFIFTPLWSQVPPEKTLFIQTSINDFHKIKYRSKKYTVANHNDFHKRALKFVTNAVKASKAKNKVVVTHFVPTGLCNNNKYKTSPINEFFISELYDFIEQSDIDYWIYGHHHYNMPDLQIGHTKLVTNQLGYVDRDEYRCYINNAVFELK